MKKVLCLISLQMVFLFPVALLAQSPTPAVSPLPLNGAVTAVSKASNSVPSALPAGVVIVLGLLGSSEVIMRAVPTQKALSWFLGIAALLSVVITLLQKVVNLMTVIGQSLNNVSASPPSS